MRVLFDGFWWVHGPGANRTVLRETVYRWAERYPDDEIGVLVRRGHAADAVDLPAGAQLLTSRLWPQAASNALELGAAARHFGADVVVAHNYAPLTGRTVLFIHDILFEDHPEWFTRAERVYFSPMGLLARRATRVLTSTRVEAERIERRHPRLSPVGDVGLAVATELLGADPAAPAGVHEGDRFVISVGRLNERKNLGRALTAAIESGVIGPHRRLLVVGSGAHSGRIPDLPDLVEVEVERGSIVLLGRISDGELRWLYERADAMVYVSLDEGFGLPPIEAAAFGTPAVVSDIPVFRETVGGHGFFADPLDTASIAEALREAVASSRADETETARDIASRYSWNRTVDGMREAARHAIGG